MTSPNNVALNGVSLHDVSQLFDPTHGRSDPRQLVDDRDRVETAGAISQPDAPEGVHEQIADRSSRLLAGAMLYLGVPEY